MNTIQKICVGCGKNFKTANRKWYARNKTKFCSTSCASKNTPNKGRFKKGQKGWWKGKKRPEFQGENNIKWVEKIIVSCLQCGKDIVCTKAVRRKYCSQSCRAKYWFTGERNPRWNNGSSTWKDILKSSDEYKAWRMRVFQRDRFTCRWCGHRSKVSKPKPDIEANHIYPLRFYPKLALKVSNGITLCVNCHKKTYGKEMKLVMVFKEILNDYMTNKEKS